MGPNVKNLVIKKMSLDVIFNGGGFADGIKFLSNPATIAEGFRSASAWVDNAIAVVRSETEQNPFKDSTDEDIAGEILRRIEEKRC